MQRRTRRTVRIALLLGAALTTPAAGAGAKLNCPKLCRKSIKACVSAAKSAADCKALHGTARNACNKQLRITEKACRTNALSACTASAGASCSGGV